MIRNLQQPDLLQDKFELEFNSFCSSVWKQQAARFLLPVLPYLKIPKQFLFLCKN